MSRRKTDGAFHTIFQELKQEDAEGFRGYIRLDTKSFEKLVDLLTPSLLKKNSNMRECIKPEELCCVALRCFVTGECFRSLECQFRISKKAVSYIIEEVAAFIIKILGKTYLNTPATTDEWLKISQKFKERWNFPNGIGAVDGKHILQKPKKLRLSLPELHEN